jgi:hypothetical protein
MPKAPNVKNWLVDRIVPGPGGSDPSEVFEAFQKRTKPKRTVRSRLPKIDKAGLKGLGMKAVRNLGPLAALSFGFWEGKNIYQTLAKTRQKKRDYAMLPEATPDTVLRDMRDRELMAIRRARLARADPEAYAVLTSVLQGETPPPVLAPGDFILGNLPEPTMGSEASMDELLSTMAGGP